MIKRFIKRTGRALKKLGKEIGKPFKSMMKTKIGKIIGTIGMMMIGGWMMAGAKTFASTLWAGQGVGTAFSSGISAMGNAAATSFKTITGGIQNMFTKGGTQSAGAGAENLKTDILNNPEVKVDTQTLSESSKEFVKQTGGVDPTDVTKAAQDTTLDGKFYEAGAQTASGKVAGDDILVGRLEKSLANLPEPGSAGSSLKWDTATNKYIPKTEKELMTGRLELATQGEPAKYIARDAKKGVFGLRNERTIIKDMFPQTDPITGQYSAPEGFTQVAHGADMTGAPKNLLDKVYDMPYAELNEKYGLGYKPLKSFEGLPGILREGTVGEAKLVYDFTRPIPDPYIPGSSDMTGAISALSENESRLYSAMPVNQMLNQKSIPSPSVIGTEEYMSKTKKAGFVWDTSLLSVNPSNIPT